MSVTFAEKLARMPGYQAGVPTGQAPEAIAAGTIAFFLIKIMQTKQPEVAAGKADAVAPVATPDAEWQEIQLRELERDSWIADGIQEGRIDANLWLDAADAIVFMDVSPLTSIWRVTKRRLDSADGPEMPADCKPAPFYRAFPRFLNFIWAYRRVVRPEVLADLARREQAQQVAILRNEEDVQRFLASVKAQRAPLGESSLT